MTFASKPAGEQQSAPADFVEHFLVFQQILLVFLPMPCVLTAADAKCTIGDLQPCLLQCLCAAWVPWHTTTPGYGYI